LLEIRMRVTPLKTILAAALLTMALPSHQALAQTPASPPAADQKAFAKREASDRKVVEKALTVTSIAELEPMVPGLQKWSTTPRRTGRWSIDSPA
jgi:hypothetical protein